MHLCIDTRMAYSSGIGTYIRNLIPRLDPVFKLTLLVDPQRPFPHSNAVPFEAPIYSMREQILFPFKIPCCDIFWSPNYNVPLLPIRAKKRIVTIHDAYHLAYPQSRLQHLYARFVMSRAFHHSDAVFTDSQFSASELRRFFSSSREIHVIGLSPNWTLFQPTKSTPVSSPYFLFVGNHKPNKNLAGLLEAFELFVEKTKFPHRLCLVGKKQGLRSVTELKPSSRVSILGEVLEEALPQLYANAAALVFPSFYEGFGLPPLEAMAVGCPTIVSCTASLPEVVGNASLFVKPDNPSDIANAMIRIASDPELVSSSKTKGFAQAKLFSWEKTAEGYIKILNDLNSL